jgi:hypothetical protein
MGSTTHEQISAEFLKEIEAAIEKHQKDYGWDTFWYQFIVILSAICGLLSLVAGTAFQSPTIAGIFGGATTIATVLTQTLHCVKAQGWQDRMKTELESIRIQFLYEHGSLPTPEGLINLSMQYRDLKVRMAKEWERVISAQAGGLNLRLAKNRRGSEEQA